MLDTSSNDLYSNLNVISYLSCEGLSASVEKLSNDKTVGFPLFDLFRFEGFSASAENTPGFPLFDFFKIFIWNFVFFFISNKDFWYHGSCALHHPEFPT